MIFVSFLFFFFFNDTATTEIYTLSLHDALPISLAVLALSDLDRQLRLFWPDNEPARPAASRFIDRKSTRLNSSHTVISYAVFCLKKKKKPRPASLYTPQAINICYAIVGACGSLA